MPPKKKQYDDDVIEPEFRFSDITILEADGEFEEVIRIMKEDGESATWCLVTDLTLIHPFGICDAKLELFNDGRVKIISINPSSTDPLLNMDIRCIRGWCAVNGWLPPEPSEHVAQQMISFWKHMWDVHLINSPYLDLRYGKRRDADYEEINP